MWSATGAERGRKTDINRREVEPPAIRSRRYGRSAYPQFILTLVRICGERSMSFVIYVTKPDVWRLH
jgi:hypothetical protein